MTLRKPITTPSKRAETLLLRHLTPEQTQTYKRSGYIRIIGSTGGIFCIHRVPRGAHVYRVRNQRHTYSYCTKLSVQRGTRRRVWDIPAADHVLTYKMFIEGDQRKFVQLQQMVVTQLFRAYCPPKPSADAVASGTSDGGPR